MFIGEQSGLNNDYGWSNVCIGKGSGKYLTSGYANIFIGVDAGHSYTTENNILEIGRFAGNKPKIWADYSHVVIGGDGSDNSIGATFFVNGTAGAPGGFFTVSDESLKTNVAPIQNALSKVKSLQGVNFEWKDKENFDDKPHIGFIAQDIQQIIPEVVLDSENHYAIDYASITALLVEAIKEQQQMIEFQKLEIEELRSKLMK